jgi:hypothetical protein
LLNLDRSNLFLKDYAEPSKQQRVWESTIRPTSGAATHLASSAVVCKSCLSPLQAFQIDYKHALKICTNLSCNERGSSPLDNFIERDYTRCSQGDVKKEGEEEDTSSRLSILLDGFIDETNKIADHYEAIASSYHSSVAIDNGYVASASSPLPLFDDNDFIPSYQPGLISGEPLELVPLENLNASISLPTSPVSTEFLNNDNNNNNSESVRVDEVGQQNNNNADANVLFDENFFSSIDNFLFELIDDTSCPAAVVNPLPEPTVTFSQSNESSIGFRSSLVSGAAEANGAQQDVPSSSSTSNFVELRPINQSELASKMAADVYACDFANANSFQSTPPPRPTPLAITTHLHQEESLISSPAAAVTAEPPAGPSQETIVVRESKSSDSSIVISKTVRKNAKKNKNPADTNKKQLEILDEELMDIDILLDNSVMMPTPSSKKAKTVALKCESSLDEALSMKTPVLLPWEIKTKSFNRKLID